MTQVEMTQAQANLLKLIERAEGGEEIVITRGSKPVVRLVAVGADQRPRRQFGSAKGLITFAEDFEAPLEDFAEYT